VKDYFKFLMFYCFSVTEATINLFCALFGYYPKLDFSVSFLTAIELRRVMSELLVHTEDKKEKLDSADSNIEQAKLEVFNIDDE
jgi:hypothetical protein